MVERPEEGVAGLRLLGEEEWRQVVEEWNRTEAAIGDGGIHELFEQQVERTPEGVALVQGERRISYRELNQRANRLAHFLRNQHVGRETIVALFVERSMETIVSLLGILKAGGAYLPIDSAAPLDRIAFMLQDAKVHLIITDHASSDKLPQNTIPRLYIESLTQTEEDPPADSLPYAARTPREQLAYVIYTSGSTGRPKGVCISHGAVARLALARNYVRVTEEDVVLHMAPVSFDAATFEIWSALLHGASIAIADQQIVSLQELGEMLRRRGVTTLWLTAPLFHQMVDTHPDDLRGVRNLLAGGDVLSPQHVRLAQQTLSSGTVINGYGPTENTTFTCCSPMDEPLQGATVPIGRPIDNTRVYLLDKEMQPVPVGVPGELYAAGAGLARGYLGRPDLTAEKFIPDPFDRAGGRRLYRTGDLARWLPDGKIAFMGRMDLQVKIRGFRIELGEIESALEGIPEVSQAVVVVREDEAGEKQLVAYTVCEGDIPPSRLREALKLSLPDYMVPSVFMNLEALPLTANGKIDRRVLPAPVMMREQIFIPPRNPVEEKVATLFAELLRVDQVGIEDDFFALGGHSLLATRAISRINDAFAIEMPLRRLFELPRVADLAEAIEAARASRSTQKVPAIARVARAAVSWPAVELDG